MSVSMYEASIPVFVRGLKNLSAILEKAVTNAEIRRIKPEVLVNARLAPDMLPLSAQIQILSDSAKGCAARLAGVEVPSFADAEVTFDDLQERIEKTLTFIQGIAAADVDGSEDHTVVLKIGGRELSFSGKSYLLNFAMPNFYFHLTTAYAILRHNGVDIGKRDYLGDI
ncbi:DUF1993 domain-containing protein [Pokkaliibacter sp. MBI-7]|uniref:DUF1993 domain-containing protein n=1 Tax=Pokkaliibacter sp. MBI-7 TaxID=3040600 RepID=UPI0024469431|nr:DUF1993 domain-containing protein [Pokkaliibacter sp. MBI-7]MDH2435052.1 DUF1993 domain-containing protein [Pokkaliibacter sp. MBI-7]